jgi:DnaK suppressor protein
MRPIEARHPRASRCHQRVVPPARTSRMTRASKCGCELPSRVMQTRTDTSLAANLLRGKFPIRASPIATFDRPTSGVRTEQTKPKGPLMNRAQNKTTALASPPDIITRLPELRKALVQQRQIRLDQLEDLAESAAYSSSEVDDARDPVNEILWTGAAAALAEVEHAMDRMRAGRYGVCERCMTHIPYERLEILPMSRYCISCQRGIRLH